jgi:hypothetical protein
VTKKVLLAILLVWAATFTIPGLRDRAEPRALTARAWVGDRLEGPLTPVRDRYRKAQTRSQLDKTQRALVMNRNQGGRIPEQEQLGQFMARHDIVPDGRDPWGTPYLIVQEADSLAIVSAGPDLTYHTDDDLVVRVRHARRAPRSTVRR